MHLSRLLISDFKNINQAQLAFSPGINVLYGDNGEGKTNLLDAIYYLSLCKARFPFRTGMLYVKAGSFHFSESMSCNKVWLKRFLVL